MTDQNVDLCYQKGRPILILRCSRYVKSKTPSRFRRARLLLQILSRLKITIVLLPNEPRRVCFPWLVAVKNQIELPHNLRNYLCHFQERHVLSQARTSSGAEGEHLPKLQRRGLRAGFKKPFRPEDVGILSVELWILVKGPGRNTNTQSFRKVSASELCSAWRRCSLQNIPDSWMYSKSLGNHCLEIRHSLRLLESYWVRDCSFCRHPVNFLTERFQTLRRFVQIVQGRGERYCCRVRASGNATRGTVNSCLEYGAQSKLTFRQCCPRWRRSRLCQRLQA